jgi:hypothetical protein
VLQIGCILSTGAAPTWGTSFWNSSLTLTVKSAVTPQCSDVRRHTSESSGEHLVTKLSSDVTPQSRVSI